MLSKNLNFLYEASKFYIKYWKIKIKININYYIKRLLCIKQLELKKKIQNITSNTRI